MPDTKITALTALTAADPANDVLPIVDVSDTTMAASGTTKKISINNVLGCSGTATLASATITGDLTVDTSTLKVDSANNRVGIGTASPTAALHVSSTGSVHINQRTGNNGCFTQYMDPTSSNYVGTDSGNFRVANNSAQDLLNIQQLGVFTFGDGAGGNRMTLNSTGLGVGTIPGASTGSSKIAVVGGATYDGNFDIIANFTNSTASAAKGVLLGYNNSTNNGIISAAYGSGTEGLTFWTHNGSSWGQRMELTATGNVGIGITPSAWSLAGYKGLEIGVVGNGIFSGLGDVNISSNAYYNGGWKYAQSSVAASSYQQNAGQHIWKRSTSTQTIGTDPVFVASMTLDANGNLILQSSATPATLTTNGQLTVNATSNTNLRFSYRGSDGVTRVANITLA